MITEIRKNMNLFVDGIGFAGKVEEINPPKLAVKMEEFRAGGMDAPIEVDMGMEKLEMDFSIPSMDQSLIGLFGLAPGSEVSVSIRGAIEDNAGSVKAEEHKGTGLVKSIEPGGMKAGEKPSIKVAMSLKFYSLTIDGNELLYIDVENMIRRINGQDRLEAIRAAIGI